MNGLVHNHVNAIYPDSRGFLWICTDEGLARFDGREFNTYTRQNGIPHIHVNAIVETHDGEYWIATDSGVAQFHPRRAGAQFEALSLGAPPAQFVNSLVEDRDGSLLAGTNDGLFRVLRGSPARVEPVKIDIAGYPAGMPINQILVTPDANWWLATEAGLLRKAKGGPWLWLTQKQGLPDHFVSGVVLDPRGRIWAGTRLGAARLSAHLDPQSPAVDLVVTAKRGLPDSDVRAFHFAHDGSEWIGTMNGLARWDSQSGRVIQAWRRKDGLADETIYAIAEDPAGNLWFGTRRGGLLELRHSAIQAYGQSEGLNPSGDEALVEGTSGEICVASIGDTRRPLQCLESGRFVHVLPKLPPAALAAGTTSGQWALQDRLGALWISTSRGLFRFPKVRSPFDLWLLPHFECTRLLEDREGNIWVGTRQGANRGLARWDAKSRRIADLTARLTDRVRAIGICALADDGSSIWLGLCRPGGLLRLRGETVEEVPGIPPGTVNAIHCDLEKHVWVATSDTGLAEVDTSSATPPVRVYDTRTHLSSNEVWSIAEDRLGRIYAGTARGVDRIDPHTGAVLNYSMEDGLAPGDIRSAHCDRDGDLWFLSNEGLSRLRMADPETLPMPMPRITQVRAGGKLELLSEFGETNAGTLRLQPDQSSVEIDFLTVAHQAPWRLQFVHRLVGPGDTGWSARSSISAVQFAHLPAGHYRFEVRTVGGMEQSSPPALLEFQLLPPFWQRIWFRSAMAVLFGAVIYALHHYRLHHALALERVRTRLATDLHDVLGAGLAEIAIVSEVARRKPASGSSDTLQYVADRARLLRASLSDLVWSVDPTRDRLPELVNRMRETALSLLEPAGRKVEVVIPARDKIEDIELPPDLRRHLFLFFKEAASNAARHSEANTVWIELAISNGDLRIAVRDNGCGFDPQAPTAGRGLASLRYRARETGGDLRIDSAPGRGAEIALRVQLRRDLRNLTSLRRSIHNTAKY
jgi:ligand-binding sensor domain-containing protein/signal transduction histidine kinase